MARPTLELAFSDLAALYREVEANLSKGRTFVRGAEGVEMREICELLLRHPVTGARLGLPAEVVWVEADGAGKGVGLELTELDIEELRAFVSANAAGVEDQAGASPGPGTGDDLDSTSPPDDDEASGLPPGIEPIDDDAAQSLRSGTVTWVDESDEVDSPSAEHEPAGARRDAAPRTIHERIRKLSLREQVAVARSGGLTERIALERIYGGAVWENLLQNPQLTPPEVARIAKKGNVPRPLLATICANRSWLASPEIQRALLSNPRLDGGNITKVLRALSRADLQKVPMQTAYRFAVRDAAKRMLKVP